jgi:putative tricarboxylic transport membrane protein
VTNGGSSASTGLHLDRAELVIALALIALGALVAWDAAHMRSGVAAYSRIGPRAFPYAIAAGLVAIGIATAILALRNAAPIRERDHVLPMAWIIGGLIVQIALLRYAGFAIATGAVFAATAKGFGRGPLWLTYPLGVVFSLAIWLFFAKGLLLVLPGGQLENSAARGIAWVWANFMALF